MSNSRINVLMVISQFDPIMGGAEKQAKLLARNLVKKGVNVSIATGWWIFTTPHKELIDGIQIVRNFSLWRMFEIKGIRTFSVVIYMFALGAYLLLHGLKYDIIHVHQALYPAFISVFIGKRILRKPVLVKTASSGITSDIAMLRRFPLGHLQLKYLLKEMDCLVAVSKMSRKDFEDIGYPKERIVNIPNGVEISKETKISYERTLQIITITRLSREKGVDILIYAWADVVGAEKSHKLIVIGTGPQRLEMERTVRSLKITQSVEFIGFVNNVEEYLRIADLFILPSRTEGMSNALLEAMNYGIPCIATKVGGTGELLGAGEEEIDPQKYLIAKNGLLVNPNDIRGLSEAILFMIRNPKAREEMGRRSRKLIEENYSIDFVADQYLSLYRRLLNGRF